MVGESDSTNERGKNPMIDTNTHNALTFDKLKRKETDTAEKENKIVSSFNC